MDDTVKLDKPFDNIAIAFSGGGFRAAAFALGTLSYLEHVGLTRQINYTSSTSGGTITNLLYTSYLKKGIPFNEFYKKTINALDGDQLLKKALTILNDDKEWLEAGSGKERNLINSFARVYDSKLFFNGETLSVYWNGKRDGLEVCANSTEFYRGLSFRFKTNGSSEENQIIGNFYLHFDSKQLEIVKKIKLSDILASSSCFPAGFEPICYPYDFSHPDLSIGELRKAMLYTGYDENEHSLSFTPLPHVQDPKQQNYIDSFGLMDGGITDNQGLYSLMLADNVRRANEEKFDPFDLMIITDVTSYFMDSYIAPATKAPESWRGKTIGFFEKVVKKIVRYPTKVIFASLALIIALVIICFLCTNTLIIVIGCISIGLVLPLFLLSILLEIMSTPRKIIADIENFSLEKELINLAKIKNIFSATVISDIVHFLSQTKLNLLEQMIKARISSMLSMVLDVNLKEVRRLIYDSFFVNANYENRRMPNFIYELSIHNANSRNNRISDPKRLKWTAKEEDKAILLNNLEMIQPIAESSRLMNTTLWFEDNAEGKQLLKDIVATGRFTTCMNLIEYIISLKRKCVVIPQEYDEKLNKLMDILISDLEAFKVDPYRIFVNESIKL